MTPILGESKGMVSETYHVEDWIAYFAQVGAPGH